MSVDRLAGSCWVCGALTTHRITHGRHRCPTCEGEGYVTEMDGSPLKGPPMRPADPNAPAPEKVTPLGVLPGWWADIPLSKEALKARVAVAADGRRPQIDPLVLAPPDSPRKAVAKAREAGWEVWTALMADAGTKDRAKALVVAYRGPETVVASWEQDADLKWKPRGGTHWVGRTPGTRGEPSWTVLNDGVISTEAPIPSDDLVGV